MSDEMWPVGFHTDHDGAADILAEMFCLKRVTRRDGEWVAEFFGGTEMPFADLASNYTLVRRPEPRPLLEAS